MSMIKILFTLLMSLTFTLSFAQKVNLQDRLKTSPLDSQFFYIQALSKSLDSDFKVIRKSNIDIIHRNVKDSLRQYKAEISTLKSNSSSTVSTVKILQDTIEGLKVELMSEQERNNSISFLGIPVSKSLYQTIVWMTIVILGIAVFILLISFRKSKVDTVEHKKTAEEVQAELLAFKKKALEKEQILKRQLLDEQMKRNS